MGVDEQMVLAAAILAPEGRDELAKLSGADFTTHAARTVAVVVRDMHRRGDTIDAATVSQALESRGELAKCGGSAGIYAMCSALPTATNAGFYADRVRRATRLRMMQGVANRMRESLGSEQAIDNLEELLRWRLTAESRIPGPLSDGDLDGHTVARLLSQKFGPKTWLLPGVMLRGDRLVITGSEGLGKAWLMRQVAASAAAGVDPFTGQRFGAGYRVLVVDVENGEQEMQESFARLVSALPDNGWQERMFAYSRDAGLDLTRSDAGWLHQVASEISPDLIAIGPAYKIMYGRDPQRDTDVLELLQVLDDVRTRHDAALIVEHHAPHGAAGVSRPVRPYGSSYWLRWPSIGIGLAPHDMTAEGWDLPSGDPAWDRPHFLDVVQWRFMRGTKRWPKALQMGSDSELPWVEWDSYTPNSTRRIA